MPISNQPSVAIGAGANVGAVDDLPTDGVGMALHCQGRAPASGACGDAHA